MYKIIYLSLFVVTMFFSVNQILAQEKPEFGTILKSESEFTFYEKDPEATGIYLSEYGHNFFDVRDNYIWLITKYHAKVKVLNMEGFKNTDIEIPLYHSKKSKEKIDGVAATIMALAEYMTEEKEGDSVYDNRGLLIL